MNTHLYPSLTTRAARVAAAAGGICLLAASGAVAQPTEMAQATNAEPVKMEKTVVTGSLLPTAETVGVAPVEVYTAEQVERTGVKSIDQLVARMPSAVGSGNFGDSRGNGGDGSASIALRGIPGGTLVLVNGRRLPPNAFYDGSTVDLNVIPLAAVDRIEILKDGGSALYGADAVAGVVNVILKKNINFTDFGAYYGNTTDSDVSRQNYYFVSGMSDEKSSFLVGGSFYKANALYSKDRDRSSPDLSDPRNTSGTSNPGRIRSFVEGSTIPAGGLVYDGPPGTTGTSIDDYRPFSGATDRFPYPLYTPAIRPSERWYFFGNGERELIKDYLKFFAEGSYAHTWSYNQLAPTPIVFPNLSTPAHPETGIVIPASHPYNVFGQDIDTMLYRVVELGPRTDTITADNFRIVTGLRGQIPDTSYSWETAFLYGDDSRVERLGGEISRSGLDMAINDPNPATAFNPFGNQANTPEQLAQVAQEMTTLGRSTLWSVDGLVRGEPTKLPGGPLGVAIGAQWSEERFESVPDRAQQIGDTVGFNSAAPLYGARDVFSAYGEARIPIFGPDLHLPALHSFELTVAGRVDNYSDFGDTWNPKVQIRWQPIDESVTLRGSYSTSFRAPTFSDLYTLPSEDFPELRNPVRDELSRTDPNFDTDIYPVFEQIRTFRSGNPDLDPEEAQNWTAGIVWTPHFAKRLTISGDWFSIYQENVPGSVDQFILDQNFLGADPTLPVAQRPTDPNAPFANLIRYDPNTLAYNVLYSPTFNLSRRIVEGFDIGIRYTLPTEAAGTWTFGGDLTYYYKFQQANLPGDPLVDRLGDFIDPTQGFGLGSLPRIKASMSVFWNFHDLEFGVISYYVGSYKDDEAAGFNRHVQDIWTFDLQASYTLPYDFKITFGVQNVADTEPPLVQGAFADNYDRDTHSLLGRFVYGQLTKKF